MHYNFEYIHLCTVTPYTAKIKRTNNNHNYNKTKKNAKIKKTQIKIRHHSIETTAYKCQIPIGNNTWWKNYIISTYFVAELDIYVQELTLCTIILNQKWYFAQFSLKKIGCQMIAIYNGETKSAATFKERQVKEKCQNIKKDCSGHFLS